jgi:hypothetical protein
MEAAQRGATAIARAKAIHAACVGDGAAAVEARFGTVAWYQAHMHDNVYSDSKLTLMQVVYFFLMWKRQYRVGRKAMDSFINFMSLLLPSSGNILPPTLHLFQRVIKAADWQQYELHICSREGCTGHAWEYLHPSEWLSHQDDKCPKCNGPRFTTSRVTGNAL